MMCGQGKTKVKKEYLASSVLSLLRITEEMTPLVIGSRKELELEALALRSMDDEVVAVDPNELSKLAGNINQQIRLNDDRLESANLEFVNNTKTLKELLTTLESTRSDDAASSMKPNTTSPHQRPYKNEPPCDPYVAFINDTVPKEMRQDLLKFTDGQTFNTQETCDSIYFGEYGYYGAGVKYEAKPLPPALISLLHHVRPLMPNPDMNFNSCFITRYKWGSKYSPHKSEVEPVIDPASVITSIYISEGNPRKLNFAPKGEHSGVKTEVVLADSSLCTYSRFSQDFWTHVINKDESEDGIHYSFTFRNIAPHFLNSTVIIGDSNTTRLKFGHERGQFGRWMPGKQITAYTVEDIPSPTSIGPYGNIVLHTDINNIKIHNRRSCESLADEIERKCDEIFSVYPRCKIFLSLALPTKLDLLNRRVREFNNMLLDLAHNYRRINIIETSSVADRYGILIDEFGRFDKRAGKYMDHYILHLGISGLRIFATSVKDAAWPT